jgi:hypothetical protein
MSEAFGPSFTMSDAEKFLCCNVEFESEFEAMEACRELRKAAESRLGPLSPAALGLASAFTEARLSDLERMARQSHGTPARGRLGELSGPLALLARETAVRLRKALGAGAPETARATALLARTLVLHGIPVNAAGVWATLLDELEDRAPGNAPSARKISPDRRGRDRLALRVAMAGCLRGGSYPASVTSLLAPVLEALGELPPWGCGGGPGWPWPPELAGRALLVAGETAFLLGDRSRAEELLRRSLDVLDPGLAAPAFLGTALDRLTEILIDRGDPAGLREAAGLQERASELRKAVDGPGSLTSLMTLDNAAHILERAGDAAGAAALHRKLLPRKVRLLGASHAETLRSQEAARRLGPQSP